VQTLLDAITEASTSEVAADVAYDAFTMWVLHLLHADQFRVLGQHKIKARVMRCCCLYPGYWTQQLGARLLETGDADFSAEWRTLFEASTLHPLHAEIDAVHSDSGLKGQVAANNRDPVEADQPAIDSICGGWMRAALPPTTPIGVVR